MAKKDKSVLAIESEIKGVARAVGASLKRAGHGVPHSVLLHALAAALDKRDWHKFKAALAPEERVLSRNPSRATHGDTRGDVVPGMQDDPRFIGPEVKARFWTDDRTYEVLFDARPYLAQASVVALLAIAEVGFVGDECTDRAAEYVADHTLNDQLGEAFAYLATLQKARRREHIGFECEIDAADFYRWMDARHRGELAVWLCNRAGVYLVRAQEPEIRGMWDWLDDAGNTCDASLPTRMEAALDAYQTLGLLQQAINRDL